MPLFPDCEVRTEMPWLTIWPFAVKKTHNVFLVPRWEKNLVHPSARWSGQDLDLGWEEDCHWLQFESCAGEWRRKPEDKKKFDQVFQYKWSVSLQEGLQASRCNAEFDVRNWQLLWRIKRLPWSCKIGGGRMTEGASRLVRAIWWQCLEKLKTMGVNKNWHRRIGTTQATTKTTGLERVSCTARPNNLSTPDTISASREDTRNCGVCLTRHVPVGLSTTARRVFDFTRCHAASKVFVWKGLDNGTA